MKLIDIPSKFQLPFASNAGAGYKRVIPVSPSGTPGEASLETGFPPENFTPVSAGGVPPFGQDFNGVLNQATAWNRWAGTGAIPPYDPTWQPLIGGYPKWSMVSSLVEFGLIWISMVDDNLTNPDTGGAGWYAFARIVTANFDLYVNGSTGNDNNNGLSPATAVATIQAAVNRAFQYPPSQYQITIHVADGTYARWNTPSWSGSRIIIDGNAGSPSSVVINNPSGINVHCCLVQGLNEVQVKNVKVQNGGTQGSGGLVAVNGGILKTQNTISGSIADGTVFQGFGGGQVLIEGSHQFSGNCFAALGANFGGIIQIANSGSVAFTITTPISVASAFAQVTQQGGIYFNAPSATFSGAAVTGVRYTAGLNGVISTNGGGANFFPGSVAGSTSTGGQYQ